MNEYKNGDRVYLFNLGGDGFYYAGKVGLESREIFLNILKSNWCPPFFTINQDNLYFHEGRLIASFLQPGYAFIYSIDDKKIKAIDGKGNIYEKKLN